MAEGKFLGDKRSLLHVIEQFQEIQPVEEVMKLLCYKTKALHPWDEDSLPDLHRLIVRYFQHEKRSVVRVCLLDCLSMVIFRFRHAYEESLMGIVMPLFKRQVQSPSYIEEEVGRKLVELLIFLSCHVSSDRRFCDLLGLFDQIITRSAAILRVLAVRGLGVVFSQKLFTSKKVHGGYVYRMMLKAGCSSDPHVQREGLICLSKLGATEGGRVLWRGQEGVDLQWGVEPLEERLPSVSKLYDDPSSYLADYFSVISSSSSDSSPSSSPSSPFSPSAFLPSSPPSLPCSGLIEDVLSNPVSCVPQTISFTTLFIILLRTFAVSSSTFPCFELAWRGLLFFARETSLLPSDHMLMLVGVCRRVLAHRVWPHLKKIRSSSTYSAVSAKKRGSAGAGGSGKGVSSPILIGVGGEGGVAGLQQPTAAAAAAPPTTTGNLEREVTELGRCVFVLLGVLAGKSVEVCPHSLSKSLGCFVEHLSFVPILGKKGGAGAGAGAGTGAGTGADGGSGGGSGERGGEGGDSSVGGRGRGRGSGGSGVSGKGRERGGGESRSDNGEMDLEQRKLSTKKTEKRSPPFSSATSSASPTTIATPITPANSSTNSSTNSSPLPSSPSPRPFTPIPKGECSPLPLSLLTSAERIERQRAERKASVSNTFSLSSTPSSPPPRSLHPPFAAAPGAEEEVVSELGFAGEDLNFCHFYTFGSFFMFYFCLLFSFVFCFVFVCFWFWFCFVLIFFLGCSLKQALFSSSSLPFPVKLGSRVSFLPPPSFCQPPPSSPRSPPSSPPSSPTSPTSLRKEMSKGDDKIKGKVGAKGGRIGIPKGKREKMREEGGSGSLFSMFLKQSLSIDNGNNNVATPRNIRDLRRGSTPAFLIEKREERREEERRKMEEEERKRREEARIQRKGSKEGVQRESEETPAKISKGRSRSSSDPHSPSKFPKLVNSWGNRDSPSRSPSRSPSHTPSRTPDRTPPRSPDRTPPRSPDRSARTPPRSPRTPPRSPGHSPGHSPSRSPSSTPHPPEDSQSQSLQQEQQEEQQQQEQEQQQQQQQQQQAEERERKLRQRHYQRLLQQQQQQQQQRQQRQQRKNKKQQQILLLDYHSPEVLPLPSEEWKGEDTMEEGRNGGEGGESGEDEGVEVHKTVEVERTCLMLLSQFATTFRLGFRVLSVPLLDLLTPLLSVKGLEIPVLVYLKALGLCYSSPSSSGSSDSPRNGGGGGGRKNGDETRSEPPTKDFSVLFRELSKLLNENNYPHLVVSLATRTLLLWFLALQKDEKERYFRVIVGAITANMALNTSLVAQVQYFFIFLSSTTPTTHHYLLVFRWLLILPIRRYLAVQPLERSLRSVRMLFFGKLLSFYSPSHFCSPPSP